MRVVQRKAESTIRRYCARARHMLSVLAIETPTDLTSAALEDYLRRLYVDGGQPSTIAGAITALRSYCAHLCRRGILGENPASKLRGPRLYQYEAPYLTVGEVSRLVYPSEMPSDPIDVRATVHVALSYVLGLRVSEPARLRVADVQLDPDGEISVLIRHGKWADRDVRVWVFDRQVASLLGAWQAVQRGLGGSWLFPSRQGGPVSPRTVARDFARLLQLRGIQPRGRRLGYHVLRELSSLRSRTLFPWLGRSIAVAGSRRPPEVPDGCPACLLPVIATTDAPAYHHAESRAALRRGRRLPVIAISDASTSDRNRARGGSPSRWLMVAGGRGWSWWRRSRADTEVRPYDSS